VTIDDVTTLRIVMPGRLAVVMQYLSLTVGGNCHAAESAERHGPINFRARLERCSYRGFPAAAAAAVAASPPAHSFETPLLH